MTNKITVVKPNELQVILKNGLGHAANQATKSSVFHTHRKELSENTQKIHSYALEHFAQFLNDAESNLAALAEEAGESYEPKNWDPQALWHDPEEWQAITHGLVEQFKQSLLAREHALSTVDVCLSVVKTYCRLAFETGLISHEQLALIAAVKRVSGGKRGKAALNLDNSRKAQGLRTRRPKSKKAQFTELTPEQVGILKHGNDLRSGKGRRDKLMFCLLADLGLRVGEVVGIQVENINLHQNIISVYRSKTGQTHVFKLTPDLKSALEDYLKKDAFSTGTLLRRAYVSGSLGRAGVSISSLTMQIKTIGKKRLGIKTLSAHDLRHYFTSSALKAGTPFADVQQGGGWADPKMVNSYAVTGIPRNQNVKLLDTPPPTNQAPEMPPEPLQGSQSVF